MPGGKVDFNNTEYSSLLKNQQFHSTREKMESDFSILRLYLDAGNSKGVFGIHKQDCYYGQKRGHTDSQFRGLAYARRILRRFSALRLSLPLLLSGI